jgi:sugar phosphate isomerase/epimerase
MKSRAAIDCLLEVGRQDAAFALCANPSCADCVRQRADIRRHRFGQEDFAVAAAASLAGRHVEEMLENCVTAGIDAVELDQLRGKPVQTLPRKEVAAAVERLRRSGCQVTALRGTALPDGDSDLVAMARESGVDRVVLPLGPGSESTVMRAAEEKVITSFYNVGANSRYVLKTMEDMRAKGLEIHLTFNATGFAGTGEKPFLTSFRNRLKRFMDQLDVEDSTFEGTPTPLAEGNAEIKELISILRCSSFAGYMVLGSGNRAIGHLREIAARFEGLLEALW